MNPASETLTVSEPLTDDVLKAKFRRAIRLMVADVGGRIAWRHYWAMRRMIRRLERLVVPAGCHVAVHVGNLSHCPPSYDLTRRVLGCVVWVCRDCTITHALILSSCGDYRTNTWPDRACDWGYVGSWRHYNRADCVLRQCTLEPGVSR